MSTDNGNSTNRKKKERGHRSIFHDSPVTGRIKQIFCGSPRFGSKGLDHWHSNTVMVDLILLQKQNELTEMSQTGYLLSYQPRNCLLKAYKRDTNILEKKNCIRELNQ